MLLLLGPVRDQRRCEQALSEEADPSRRAGEGVLLVEDDLLDDPRPAPAVLLRPGHPDPLVAAEDALPLDPGVVARLVGRPTSRPERGELTHQVLGEPAAHLVTEGGFFGGVAEIHPERDGT